MIICPPFFGHISCVPTTLIGKFRRERMKSARSFGQVSPAPTIRHQLLAKASGMSDQTSDKFLSEGQFVPLIRG